MEKNDIFEIRDKVCDVETDMEKVKVILRELELEHFNIVGIDKDMNFTKDINNPLVKLVWEYNNHRLLFDIMYDYIISAHDRINVLKQELEGEKVC